MHHRVARSAHRGLLLRLLLVLTLLGLAPLLARLLLGRLLLGRLLRARKGVGVDLLGQDLRAHKVLVVQAQPHLLQDKSDLLALMHGAERLHCHRLQDFRRLLDLALPLANAHQLPHQARALDLNVDLALGHVVERLNELDLLVHVLLRLHVQHRLLNHVAHGRLDLRAALGEQHHVLAQRRPVARLVAEAHHRHRQRAHARRLACQAVLLLQRQQRGERVCTCRRGRATKSDRPQLGWAEPPAAPVGRRSSGADA
mmetsp:Transcript_9182/g.28527  ORF Transcript_9182/g.28527 Transcript_9182/m.28527 type:complete len:256 (-) Transcript_9182:67-834(-)